MDKITKVKSEEILKIRKKTRHLSSTYIDHPKSRKSLIPDPKNPLLPMLNPSFKPSDTFSQHPLQRTPEKLISKFNRIFDKKLEEKLKNLDKTDDFSQLKAHLEIFEKIISVDSFGHILDKIRIKLVNHINKLGFKDEPESKIQKIYENEIGKLRETLKDFEISKKSVEAKLKQLSMENIELLNLVDKLTEENNLFKDFKKNIKIVDGVPDAMPIIKELRTKTTMLDTIDKKNKGLMKKERYLIALIRALKEKGMNPNDLVKSHIERRSSSDSMNMSRMSMGSEISRLS